MRSPYITEVLVQDRRRAFVAEAHAAAQLRSPSGGHAVANRYPMSSSVEVKGRRGLRLSPPVCGLRPA